MKRKLKSIGTDPKVTQTIKLIDKTVKTAIITRLTSVGN